jgi:hypothetical protein
VPKSVDVTVGAIARLPPRQKKMTQIAPTNVACRRFASRRGAAFRGAAPFAIRGDNGQVENRATSETEDAPPTAIDGWGS